MTHSDTTSPTTSHSDSIGPALSEDDDFALVREEDQDFDMLASQGWSDGHSRASSTSERMRLSFPDPLTPDPEPIPDETAYSFLLDVSGTSPPSSDSPRSVTSSLPSTDFAPSIRADSHAEEVAELPSTPPELDSPKEQAISDWLKLTDEARADKEQLEEAEKGEEAGRGEDKQQVKTTTDRIEGFLKIAFEVHDDHPLIEQVLERIKKLEGIEAIGLGAGSFHEQKSVLVRFVSHQQQCIQPWMTATLEHSVMILPLLVSPSGSSTSTPSPPSTQSSLVSLLSTGSTIRPISKKINLLSFDSAEPDRADLLTAEQFLAADDEEIKEAFKEVIIDKTTAQVQPKASVIFRTLLVLAAALVIATTALLETSPSFSSLRSRVSITPSPLTSVPVAASTPSPLQTLPPAEPRALIDAAPPSACSVGRPGACALAVVDARTSLSLFATKLSAPSLFGRPGKVELRVKKRARRYISRRTSRPKMVIERKVIRKSRRARVHIDQGPSFRDALKLASLSAQRGAHHLAGRLKRPHFRIKLPHVDLQRPSSAAQVLSRRGRLGARQASILGRKEVERLAREGERLAHQGERLGREGGKKLKEWSIVGEEQLRSAARVGGEKLAVAGEKLAVAAHVGDHHLRIASDRASRHLSAAQQLARQEGARLRSGSRRLSLSALKVGRHHLVRAAAALEALRNGEVGRDGVRSCASLSSDEARKICMRRRARAQARRSD